MGHRSKAPATGKQEISKAERIDDYAYKHLQTRKGSSNIISIECNHGDAKIFLVNSRLPSFPSLQLVETKERITSLDVLVGSLVQ
jgi:hypothetical protein